MTQPFKTETKEENDKLRKPKRQQKANQSKTILQYDETTNLDISRNNNEVSRHYYSSKVN